MKKFVLITAMLLTCLCVCVHAAIPSPTTQFYAADYASLLSDDTEQFIVNNSNALYDATKAQIVVATVKNMDGKNEREYGIELARQWGIGGSEKDNGILILVAIEERKIDVEVGYGLEGALNDSKVGRFIDDYAKPYLSDDDFDTGILNLYKAILTQVYSEYGLEVPENTAPIEPDDDDEDLPDIIIGMIVIAIILVIAFSPRGRGGGDKNGGSGGAFLGGLLLGSMGRNGRNGGDGGFGGGGFGGGGSFGGGGGFGGGGSSRGF